MNWRAVLRTVQNILKTLRTNERIMKMKPTTKAKIHPGILISTFLTGTGLSDARTDYRARSGRWPILYHSTLPFIRNFFLWMPLVSSRPWQGNAGHGSGGFCLAFDGVVDDGHQDVEHNDEGESCPATQGETDDAEEDESVAQLVAF